MSQMFDCRDQGVLLYSPDSPLQFYAFPEGYVDQLSPTPWHERNVPNANERGQLPPDVFQHVDVSSCRSAEKPKSSLTMLLAGGTITRGNDNQNKSHMKDNRTVRIFSDKDSNLIGPSLALPLKPKESGVGEKTNAAEGDGSCGQDCSLSYRDLAKALSALNLDALAHEATANDMTNASGQNLGTNVIQTGDSSAIADSQISAVRMHVREPAIVPDDEPNVDAIRVDALRSLVTSRSSHSNHNADHSWKMNNHSNRTEDNSKNKNRNQHGSSRPQVILRPQAVTSAYSCEEICRSYREEEVDFMGRFSGYSTRRQSLSCGNDLSNGIEYCRPGSDDLHEENEYCIGSIPSGSEPCSFSFEKMHEQTRSLSTLSLSMSLSEAESYVFGPLAGMDSGSLTNGLQVECNRRLSNDTNTAPSGVCAVAGGRTSVSDGGLGLDLKLPLPLPVRGNSPNQRQLLTQQRHEGKENIPDGKYYPSEDEEENVPEKLPAHGTLFAPESNRSRTSGGSTTTISSRSIITNRRSGALMASVSASDMLPGVRGLFEFPVPQNVPQDVPQDVPQNIPRCLADADSNDHQTMTNTNHHYGIDYNNSPGSHSTSPSHTYGKSYLPPSGLIPKSVITAAAIESMHIPPIQHQSSSTLSASVTTTQSSESYAWLSPRKPTPSLTIGRGIPDSSKSLSSYLSDNDSDSSSESSDDDDDGDDDNLEYAVGRNRGRNSPVKISSTTPCKYKFSRGDDDVKKKLTSKSRDKQVKFNSGATTIESTLPLRFVGSSVSVLGDGYDPGDHNRTYADKQHTRSHTDVLSPGAMVLPLKSAMKTSRNSSQTCSTDSSPTPRLQADHRPYPAPLSTDAFLPSPLHYSSVATRTRANSHNSHVAHTSTTTTTNGAWSGLLSAVNGLLGISTPNTQGTMTSGRTPPHRSSWAHY